MLRCQIRGKSINLVSAFSEMASESQLTLQIRGEKARIARGHQAVLGSGEDMNLFAGYPTYVIDWRRILTIHFPVDLSTIVVEAMLLLFQIRL